MVYAFGLWLPLSFWAICQLLAFITGKSTKKIDEKLAYFLLVYYLFFTVFRAESVGKDLHNYIRRFELIGGQDWSYIGMWHDRWNFEYGYLVLNKVISLLSRNVYILIGLVSIFTQVVFFIKIKRNSLSCSLSYYIFNVFLFWATSLNLTRLFLAVAICLLSMGFIQKKKLIKFILLVGLASLFHSSAIIFLIIYPISFIRVNKKTIMLFLVAGVTLYFLMETILPKAISLFSALYYQRYADQIGYGSGQSMLLLLLIILTVSIINYQSRCDDKDAIENVEQELWIKMLMLGIFFNIVALRLEIASRMMWYFKISLLFIIPNTLQDFCIKTRHKSLIKFGYLLFVICIPLIFYFRSMETDNFGITPYVFVWE